MSFQLGQSVTNLGVGAGTYGMNLQVIVSGASTGIGRACAVHLAGLGHNVWAGVRSQGSFDELMRLDAKGLVPIFLDVRDGSSIALVIHELRRKAGRLDVLINNAGIAVC